MADLINSTTEVLFQSVLGKNLIGLTRDQYIFNDEPSLDDAGSLQLQFDPTCITLHTCADGESVRADSKPIELTAPFSIDEESHCNWMLVDLLAYTPWSRLQNQTLQSVDVWVDTMVDLGVSKVIGWMLRFDANYICYFNAGDNSRILFDESPQLDPFDGLKTSCRQIAKR